jgi:hypothetical protein
MANVSRLLYTTMEQESFFENLQPTDALLKQAKTKIRDHLRKVFRETGQAVLGLPVQPRFFTQGSFAYKTLNEPAWPPAQQKDLDDGCYLPLSFVRGEKPSKAAAMFFDFVDAALKELARTESWKHVEKPTCSRLVIADDAHIDVPLYAIPDSDYRLLESRITQDGRIVVAKANPDNWDALPSNSVLLAHREEDWVESDPRKINDWFNDAVTVYGERLRRDCRYLKAWRDHHKLDGVQLTSILLMACVWRAYEDISDDMGKIREDQRLLKVVEKLAGYIANSVANPAEPSEDLNRMSVEQRKTVGTAITNLQGTLRDVVSKCDDERSAVDQMMVAFGERVPDRPDLVVLDTTPVASIVFAQPKKIVAAPAVGRSLSG